MQSVSVLDLLDINISKSLVSSFSTQLFLTLQLFNYSAWSPRCQMSLILVFLQEFKNSRCKLAWLDYTQF